MAKVGAHGRHSDHHTGNLRRGGPREQRSRGQLLQVVGGGTPRRRRHSIKHSRSTCSEAVQTSFFVWVWVWVLIGGGGGVEVGVGGRRALLARTCTGCVMIVAWSRSLDWRTENTRRSPKKMDTAAWARRGIVGARGERLVTPAHRHGPACTPAPALQNHHQSGTPYPPALRAPQLPCPGTSAAPTCGCAQLPGGVLQRRVGANADKRCSGSQHDPVVGAPSDKLGGPVGAVNRQREGEQQQDAEDQEEVLRGSGRGESRTGSVKRCLEMGGEGRQAAKCRAGVQAASGKVGEAPGRAGRAVKQEQQTQQPHNFKFNPASALSPLATRRTSGR